MGRQRHHLRVGAQPSGTARRGGGGESEAAHHLRGRHQPTPPADRRRGADAIRCHHRDEGIVFEGLSGTGLILNKMYDFSISNKINDCPFIVTNLNVSHKNEIFNRN